MFVEWTDEQETLVCEPGCSAGVLCPGHVPAGRGPVTKRDLKDAASTTASTLTGNISVLLRLSDGYWLERVKDGKQVKHEDWLPLKSSTRKRSCKSLGQ